MIALLKQHLTVGDAAEKSPHRCGISCVRLEQGPNGTFATASDGQGWIQVRLPMPDATPMHTLIHCEDWGAVKATADHGAQFEFKGKYITIHGVDEHARVVRGATIQPVPDEIPPHRETFAVDKGGSRYVVDAKKLAAILRIVGGLSGADETIELIVPNKADDDGVVMLSAPMDNGGSVKAYVSCNRAGLLDEPAQGELRI